MHFHLFLQSKLKALKLSLTMPAIILNATALEHTQEHSVPVNN